jgi:hypothetical protein
MTNHLIDKIICDKYQVPLYMIKDENTISFRLVFNILNPNYDLENMMGLNLISLIGTLNPDVVESLVVDDFDSTTTNINSTMVLAHFGQELGISQKYIYSNITMHKENNQVVFNSIQRCKPESIVMPKKIDPVLNSNSMLTIKLNSSHEAIIQYDFDLKLENDIPVFMEKMPGLLMKKIFIRLKLFLEGLT